MFFNYIDIYVWYNFDNYNVWYLEFLKSYLEVSYDFCIGECKYVYD